MAISLISMKYEVWKKWRLSQKQHGISLSLQWSLAGEHCLATFPCFLSVWSFVLLFLRVNPLVSKTLDLIITPALAFDSKNGRLGKGKGFYDKFFDECEEIFGAQEDRKMPYKLGIVFHQQMVDEVPMSDHDHYVDAIIHD